MFHRYAAPGRSLRGSRPFASRDQAGVLAPVKMLDRGGSGSILLSTRAPSSTGAAPQHEPGEAREVPPPPRPIANPELI
jgi:hypothetical protein